MKIRLILLLALMLSFTSLFSQQKYPIQTLFKGDSVVILKYSQAMEINELLNQKNLIIDESNLTIKKYNRNVLSLKDTVKDLKWKLNVTQADLTRKLTKKTDTLAHVSLDLENANQQIAFYKNEMKRIEKLEWIEKRTRTQMKVGIAGVIVTWLVLVISSVK